MISDPPQITCSIRYWQRKKEQWKMAWNMEPLKEHIVNDCGDGIFEITSPPHRYKEYLVLGSERAALIDTGFGLGSVKDQVQKITDLPIVVINTHGHPDHVGGNAEFVETHMNHADMELFKCSGSLDARIKEGSHWHIAGIESMLQPDGTEPLHIDDGEMFDLGGRTLTAVYTPGHTEGSIVLKDSKTGAVFAGDNIMASGVLLIERWATTVEVYLKSLEKIRLLEPTAIYSGHMPGKVAPAQIDKIASLTSRILAGEEGTPFKNFMGEGLRLEENGTGISYKQDKIS